MNPTREVTYEIKELFDMVYQWGRVGIVTNERCNAFLQSLNAIVEHCGGELPFEVCSQCGASPMTTDCNNANCTYYGD